MRQNPLISIITVCYNSEKTIEDTLVSIYEQTYKNIEHIIIDGCSKDETLKVINKAQIKLNINNIKTIILSEPDKGLYDAMNKGLMISTGDVIGILNSDDVFLNKDVVSTIVKEFLDKNVDCVIGGIIFAKQDNLNETHRVWKAKRGNFRLGWNPPHPSTYIKKQIYDKVGFYKTNYKISADYDLMLRVFEIYESTYSVIDDTFVKMRLGGESTKNIKSNLTGNFEIYRSLKENNVKLKFLVIFMRLIRKLSQFII